MMKGYFPECVDHKDRDRLNCKIENLRESDRIKNALNTSCRKNSSSKYVGVSRHSRNNNIFIASIGVNKRTKYLGSFLSEDEAAMCYNIAALKFHGEYANLNIIEKSA